MKIRKLIKKSTVNFWALVILISINACTDSYEEKLPNILFLFADDWGRYAGVYADTDVTGLSKVVQTPNIDKVAREGVMFLNAFNPSPSCTPCRASILTGQYIWKNGRAVNLGGGDWPKEPGVWEQQVQFPEILEELGYHNGYSGKIGVDWWDDAHPFFKDNQKYVARGNNFMHFSQFVTEKTNYDTAKQVIWNEVLGNFHDFIGKKEKNQPFFYWFGPYHTHRQWVRGSGKAIWGIKPNDLEGKLPLDWPDVFEVREDISDYLGEVQAFDHEVGIFYDELERMGELDNTIIILTGDNGIPGLPRAKRNLYDKGVHAPLIIRWGEKVAPNRQVLDFVNLMDLAPTIIAASRGNIPAGLDGKSFMNVLLANNSGQIDRKRNHVITMRERHVLHYPMRAIRTDEFLYIRNFKTNRYPEEISTQTEPGPWIFIDDGPTRKFLADNISSSDIWPYLEMAFKKRPDEELFDLTNDPMQIFNVANEQDYKDIKTKLAKKLERELKAKGDPRYLGEDWLDKVPYVKNKN